MTFTAGDVVFSFAGHAVQRAKERNIDLAEVRKQLEAMPRVAKAVHGLTSPTAAAKARVGRAWLVVERSKDRPDECVIVTVY